MENQGAVVKFDNCSSRINVKTLNSIMTDSFQVLNLENSVKWLKSKVPLLLSFILISSIHFQSITYLLVQHVRSSKFVNLHYFFFISAFKELHMSIIWFVKDNFTIKIAKKSLTKSFVWKLSRASSNGYQSLDHVNSRAYFYYVSQRGWWQIQPHFCCLVLLVG